MRLCLLHLVHILHTKYAPWFCALMCSNLEQTIMQPSMISGHFTNFPCICEAFILDSPRFAYSNYCSGVFSHPMACIDNTLVMLLGRTNGSTQQSYDSGGILRLGKERTCQAWDTAAFMMCCNVSNRRWYCCDYGYFNSCLSSIRLITQKTRTHF